MHLFCKHNYSFCTYSSYILPCVWLQFLFVDDDYQTFLHNQDLWGRGGKVWSHLVQWQNIAVNRCRRYMAEVLPIQRKHCLINKSLTTAWQWDVFSKLGLCKAYNKLCVLWSHWRHRQREINWKRFNDLVIFVTCTNVTTATIDFLHRWVK